MLRIWADGHPVGTLARRHRGAAFSYDEGVPDACAVSVLMPPRAASYDVKHGANPIFEMNAPEGHLREWLLRRHRKTPVRFDDFDVLAVVGRHLIGRLQCADADGAAGDVAPLQSLGEILHTGRSDEMREHLLRTYALYSGVSGAQPKVLIPAQEELSGGRHAGHRATHIVKFWDDYPELAANEFYCMTAAARSGLRVPRVELSDDGRVLVIERFDLAVDRRCRGFEDFCVINDLGTENKYQGGYETKLFRRITQLAVTNADLGASMLRQAFEMLVFNYAVRNGDAHLKNFGVLYDDVNGPVEMAPAYDIISTTPYLPPDTAALTLDGSKNWPRAQALTRLGQVRARLSGTDIKTIFERTADALTDTMSDLRRHFQGKHRELGEKIAGAWSEGIASSLGLAGHTIEASSPDSERPLPADIAPTT